MDKSSLKQNFKTCFIEIERIRKCLDEDINNV